MAAAVWSANAASRVAWRWQPAICRQIGRSPQRGDELRIERRHLAALVQVSPIHKDPVRHIVQKPIFIQMALEPGDGLVDRRLQLSGEGRVAGEFHVARDPQDPIRGRSRGC